MDNEKQGNGLAVVFAFFLGGIVGAILSLLFAPMPGRETREKIRDASMDAKARTVGTAHRAREVTKERVTALVDQGRTRIDEAAEGMKAAVEAGKAAFVEKKADLATIISNDSEEAEVEADEGESVS
jgi:gas vesicle protein